MVEVYNVFWRKKPVYFYYVWNSQKLWIAKNSLAFCVAEDMCYGVQKRNKETQILLCPNKVLFDHFNRTFRAHVLFAAILRCTQWISSKSTFIKLFSAKVQSLFKRRSQADKRVICLQSRRWESFGCDVMFDEGFCVFWNFGNLSVQSTFLVLATFDDWHNSD